MRLLAQRGGEGAQRGAAQLLVLMRLVTMLIVCNIICDIHLGVAHYTTFDDEGVRAWDEVVAAKAASQILLSKRD